MDGSDTAQGRLAVRHGLVGNEHGLPGVGNQACFLSNFGQDVPDAVVSSSVQAFGAQVAWRPT